MASAERDTIERLALDWAEVDLAEVAPEVVMFSVSLATRAPAMF